MIAALSRPSLAQGLPAVLTVADRELVLRGARLDDLPALVALLADDAIAETRGDLADSGDLERHRAALAEIIQDPGHEQLVLCDDSDALLATAQLTVLPGLSRRGATRLQVETVRVASTARSLGLGTVLFDWIIAVAAPAVGADLVQLTSDAQRTGARRFYERLGFEASHLGFKYQVR